MQYSVHLQILAGHNEDAYAYILNYIAHMVQRPGEKPKVALVFVSEPGCGKNIFWELLMKNLLGKSYYLQTANQDKIFCRFNSVISNKLVIMLDEAQGKVSFNNEETIKNFITAEDMPIEKKGVDGQVRLSNFVRLMIFSNNRTPIKIALGDRRFMVSKCSAEKKNNKEYFDNLAECLSDDAVIYNF